MGKSRWLGALVLLFVAWGIAIFFVERADPTAFSREAVVRALAVAGGSRAALVAVDFAPRSSGLLDWLLVGPR